MNLPKYFFVFIMLFSMLHSTFVVANSCSKSKTALETSVAEDSHHQDCGDTDHTDCETHCNHQNAFLTTNLPVIELCESVQLYQCYFFSFSQTYLDGLFRPPLI